MPLKLFCPQRKYVLLHVVVLDFVTLPQTKLPYKMIMPNPTPNDTPIISCSSPEQYYNNVASEAFAKGGRSALPRPLSVLGATAL